MAQTVYEGLYLLDTNRYGRDPEGVVGQIPKMIEKAGGEILVSRLWDERRLAYPIRGLRKGTYWLVYFRMDGSKLSDVRRQCQLSDTILRVMFLKIDPRIVDALVEHAAGGQVSKKETPPNATGVAGEQASGAAPEGEEKPEVKEQSAGGEAASASPVVEPSSPESA